MHFDSISRCKPPIETYIAHCLAAPPAFQNNEDL
jgi:hypothetical protein